MAEILPQITQLLFYNRIIDQAISFWTKWATFTHNNRKETNLIIWITAWLIDLLGRIGRNGSSRLYNGLLPEQLWW